MSNKLKPEIFKGLLIIIYLVGIIGLSSGKFRSSFQYLTPYTLLISAFILFIFHKKWNEKHILAFVLVFLGGLIIEIIGVRTGYIFGNYNYGNVLGIKVYDTPIVIGVNWLMLIYLVFSFPCSLFCGKTASL